MKCCPLAHDYVASIHEFTSHLRIITGGLDSVKRGRSVDLFKPADQRKFWVLADAPPIGFVVI